MKRCKPSWFVFTDFAQVLANLDIARPNASVWGFKSVADVEVIIERFEVMYHLPTLSRQSNQDSMPH